MRRVVAAGGLAGAAAVALALAALPAGCADRWAGLRAAAAQDAWNAIGFGLLALLSFGFLLYYRRPYSTTAFARARLVVEANVSGIWSSAFQASQQASMMAS